MSNLKGSVALVTGGSRGIGRALCLQLAEGGAHVYTCARDAQKLREVESLVPADAPGSVTALGADVTDLDAMHRVFERVGADHGHLDILVNNAAILGPRARIEDVDLQAWRQTITVNIDGVFIASKLAIEPMRAAGRAIVVNVSSSVGRRGRGGWGPYAVSKHGVEGLTDTLADELAKDGICVVSVNPGATATRMRHDAYPDEDPRTLPTPADVARTFMLLIERLTVAQTGRKYNARDLMAFVDQDAAGDALPYVAG